MTEKQKREVDIQANGMLVISWTMNKVKEMKKLTDLGVDGIITNYPGRAKILIKL
ncbi:MAG: glycerophosphodiester phosphodiesterase family protein [Ekhidna sp.]|nr:glycerophosphodiester phosphodiesterase family protein [Ekhidna sp.]